MITSRIHETNMIFTFVLFSIMKSIDFNAFSTVAKKHFVKSSHSLLQVKHFLVP